MRTVSDSTSTGVFASAPQEFLAPFHEFLASTTVTWIKYEPLVYERRDLVTYCRYGGMTRPKHHRRISIETLLIERKILSYDIPA